MLTQTDLYPGGDFKITLHLSHKNGKRLYIGGSRGRLRRAEARGRFTDVSHCADATGDTLTFATYNGLVSALLADQRMPACRKTITVFGKTLTVC